MYYLKPKARSRPWTRTGRGHPAGDRAAPATRRRGHSHCLVLILSADPELHVGQHQTWIKLICKRDHCNFVYNIERHSKILANIYNIVQHVQYWVILRTKLVSYCSKLSTILSNIVNNIERQYINIIVLHCTYYLSILLHIVCNIIQKTCWQYWLVLLPILFVKFIDIVENCSILFKIFSVIFSRRWRFGMPGSHQARSVAVVCSMQFEMSSESVFE